MTRNDKEYLKYVRIQMLWNSFACAFCGIYALFLAAILVFTPWINAEDGKGAVLCVNSKFGYPSVWEANGVWGDIFIVMHPVLIVFACTFNYLVYFSIPYKLNRIKKTQVEIDAE